MNKQVIQAMYTQVASTDPIRPNLMGVHFEKERCYATNTRILLIYNEGSEAHAGKTISAEGEEIQGRFPDVDRVIPTHKKPVPIDLDQLYRASQWYLRSEFATKDDNVLIDNEALRIDQLVRILTVFKQGNALGSIQLLVGEPERPILMKNSMFTAIIMPCNADLGLVDTEPAPECPRTISYTNLINTFAFEGWKKKPVKDQLSWLQ